MSAVRIDLGTIQPHFLLSPNYPREKMIEGKGLGNVLGKAEADEVVPAGDGVHGSVR